MRRTKEQKAITLIALIITIVVLLILAAVAISSITNDGILSYAENAGKDYNQAVVNEQELLNGYLDYLNGNGNSTDPDLEFLERYVLGAEKTGRVLTDIMDMNTMVFLDDEETTEVDESTLVTFLAIGQNENVTKGYIYAKYENKAYKIVLDITTMNTESVMLYYEPQGREGTTVAYDSNLDGTTEEWVIITDRNGKVEIVSTESMGSLTLGYGDTSVNVTTDLDGDGTIGNNADKSILSYNTAITTINNYCDEIVTATNNEGVRSVGGTDNTIRPYSSTNYDIWGAAITVDVASGDMQYEEDYIKMVYWGIEATETSYWLASRLMDNYSSGVSFCVYYVKTDGYIYMDGYLLRLQNDSKLVAVYRDYGVRPVIINPTGI